MAWNYNRGPVMKFWIVEGNRLANETEFMYRTNWTVRLNATKFNTGGEMVTLGTLRVSRNRLREKAIQYMVVELEDGRLLYGAGFACGKQVARFEWSDSHPLAKAFGTTTMAVDNPKTFGHKWVEHWFTSEKPARDLVCWASSRSKDECGTWETLGKNVGGDFIEKKEFDARGGFLDLEICKLWFPWY